MVRAFHHALKTIMNIIIEEAFIKFKEFICVVLNAFEVQFKKNCGQRK